MDTIARYVFTVLIATAITLASFYMMHRLISQDLSAQTAPPVLSIHFGPVEIPQDPRTKPPRTPPEEPEPVVQPEIPNTFQTHKIQSEPVAMTVPQLAYVPPSGPGFDPPAPGQPGTNRSASPENPVPPLYPPRAARDNLEGWVEVKVIIDANGAVQFAEVLDSHPRGVFDSAALNAVRGWNWRPRMVDGRAVNQTVVQIIEFQLRD